MESLKLFLAEMAKLKANKGVLFSVIAVLLIPIVYAGVMLSATWGPYDNVSNLPVAVVNKDTGAMQGDKEINVGKDLVEDFKKSKSLGWKFVSEQEAEKGLKNLDYYMVIEIPEDFSKNVTTVLDPEPQQLELRYIQNEGLNFMAAQVTNSATERIREQLGNKITETYVENLFTQLGQIAEGFQTAADGSDQIYAGSSELKAGTNQLLTALTEKSGDIDKLASGAQQLEAGTNELLSSLTSKQGDIAKLANGAKDLNNGTGLLLKTLQGKTGDLEKLSAGAKTIDAGLTSLQGGASQVLAGLEKAKTELGTGLQALQPGVSGLGGAISQLNGGAGQLSTATKGLSDGLQAYLAANPNLRNDQQFMTLVGTSQAVSGKMTELATGMNSLNTQVGGFVTALSPGPGSLLDGFDQLIAGQKQVVGGATALKTGSGQLAKGAADLETGWKTLTKSVATLHAGATQISAGNQTVNQGWKQLSAGATQLNTGMKQVSDGTATVQTGWGTLTAGVTQVDGGISQLNAGSEELATGLKDGAAETSSLNFTDKNIAMFSSPVNLVPEKVNKYEYYRDSTAPYILSLGLFVGILIMSFVVDFRKPAELATSGVSWFVGKFLQLSVFALIQAVVVSLFAILFLKLQVGSSIGLILFASAVSMAFLMIVFFLVSVAGNIGRFIAFVFIVLQLSTTGSNLPIEMLPEGLRAMSSFLPLTYTNAGFKAIISLDHAGSAWANASIILIILGVFFVLSLIVSSFRKGSSVNHDVNVAG